MRFYYVTGTIATIIGLIAVVSFCLFLPKRPVPEQFGLMSEEWVKKYGGPFISDFLGLSFPGQYAPVFGIGNLRTMRYVLTEEDRERAIKKLQNTFQHTQRVSVTFHAHLCDLPEDICGKEFLLLYDQYLATELIEQAELVGNTIIPTLGRITLTPPAIVFTLYPSDVKFKFYSSKLMYITLGTHDPRWQRAAQQWREERGGEGMYHLKKTFLDARLQNGETVRSIAMRVWRHGWERYSDESVPGNGNSEEPD